MDINDFKSSNIFKLYDRWISSLIAGDYLTPYTFDDEGNMLSEEVFKEDKFEEAKEEILEASHYIYREMADCRIFGSYPAGSLAYGETDTVSVVIRFLNEHKDYNPVALLGTIYFMLVYDYPTYSKILGNSRIKMRFYNELFTRIFVKIDCIQDWLNLYASLRDIVSVLELPPTMRTETALKYLHNLQEAGFLDINYRWTPRVSCYAFKKLIAENLYIYADCPYTPDLEEHFGEKNLRDNRALNTLKSRISKTYKEKKEIEKEKVYKSIQSCFSKT